MQAGQYSVLGVSAVLRLEVPGVGGRIRKKGEEGNERLVEHPEMKQLHSEEKARAARMARVHAQE